MSHSFKATKSQIEKVIKHYRGYEIPPTNDYTLFRAKFNRVNITIYKTETILFQGKNEDSEYMVWAEKFNLPTETVTEVKDNQHYYYMSVIGSDEVGTGDFFGPIVVAACYVKTEYVNHLRDLGVRDSKLLKDSQIIKLASKITATVPYSIMVLSNQKYNSMYQEGEVNQNIIKALLHNSVIGSLIEKLDKTKDHVDVILVDEFIPKDKYLEYIAKHPHVITNIETVQKGEGVHLAIAAASILARYAFLKQLNQMSKDYGVTLLKGASEAVDKQIADILSEKGLGVLTNIGKLNFSNYERAKSILKRLQGIKKPVAF
jgi:ribonuclease HIII